MLQNNFRKYLSYLEDASSHAHKDIFGRENLLNKVADLSDYKKEVFKNLDIVKSASEVFHVFFGYCDAYNKLTDRETQADDNKEWYYKQVVNELSAWLYDLKVSVDVSQDDKGNNVFNLNYKNPFVTITEIEKKIKRGKNKDTTKKVKEKSYDDKAYNFCLFLNQLEYGTDAQYIVWELFDRLYLDFWATNNGEYINDTLNFDSKSNTAVAQAMSDFKVFLNKSINIMEETAHMNTSKLSFNSKSKASNESFAVILNGRTVDTKNVKKYRVTHKDSKAMHPVVKKILILMMQGIEFRDAVEKASK